MKGILARWVYGRSGGMRHRLLSWPLALAVVVALHVFGGYSLARLTFNNSAEVYFPDGAPAVQLRDALRRDFPSDEVLTVLFQGDDLYRADFLQRLQRAAEIIERHPLVDRVTTVTSFERISGTDDGFAVNPLLDPGRLAQTRPDESRQRVLGDRFAPGLLASRDGRHLALAVRPKVLTESGQRLALKVAVAAAVNDAGLRPYYAGDAGPVTMDVAQLQSILRDSARFIPLTVLVGLALLYWVVGRVRPVVIGGVAMSTVVVPTIGAVSALDQPYTMATAILPSLLAAYTVVTLMHLYAGVQRAQRASHSRSRCVDEALGETLKPSAFNVLTTSAGLLSLLLVPIPPIRVFGLMGALGTLTVFLVVYFLVPPFLRHWDRGRWPQRASGMGRLGRLARHTTILSMRWPKTVVAVLVALVAVLFPYTQRVEVETDMLAFFAPSHPINVDTKRIEANLAGVTTLEISLRGGARDAFQRVATLGEVRRFQRWLETLPEVDRSISMVDLVEEMHWAMNGERAAFRDLPRNDRLLRQYLLVYDGRDLFELVNRDFDHARIVLNLNVHGTREVSDVVDRIRAHLAEQPLAGVQVGVAGYGRLIADQIELLVSGQVRSFAGAFGQIFFLMTLLWRSPKAAAICMVPNLAPLFFVFVLMGATGISLDMATVMIAAVVLGITVDDTIHLYHGYRQRRLAGASPLAAIARSYDSTGRAVLATSVVLIAQFALLTTSDFIPTANFGLMTAVGLLAGLLFEVLLLPALLVLTAGLPWTWRSALGLRSHPRRSKASRVGAMAALSAAESAAPMVRRRVLVCHGDACRTAGAAGVWRRLREEQGRLMDAGRSGALQLTKTSCLGPCRFAPVIQVYPEDVCYGLLDGPRLDQIVDEHLGRAQPVQRLALPASLPSAALPNEAKSRSENPDIAL